MRKKTTSKPRKLTPQQKNAQKERNEAKRTPIDKLYIRLGKEKTELKKAENETQYLLRIRNKVESEVRAKISKTKRLIQYKQKELGV